MKTDAEIVRTEIEVGGADIGWEAAYQILQSVKKDPKNCVTRFNNSLFLSIPVDPEASKFFMYNADTVADMPKSLKSFFDSMSKKNVKKLICTTKRKAMIRMAQKTGYQLKFHFLNGVYQVEVVL